MSMHSARIHSKAGFTLVELSIVLVIIGLLISGILAAQSMIATAKVNKIIRSLQQYDIAVKNFYQNFRKYPGDANMTIGSCPAGNNDGENGSAQNIEPVYAFGVLNSAGYTSESLSCSGYTPWTNTAERGVNAPALPGKGMLLLVSRDTSNNKLDGDFYGVVPFPNCQFALLAAAPIDGNRNDGAYLSPLDAGAIDNKIDDSSAISGRILNGNGVGINGGATGCIDNGDFMVTDRPTRKLNAGYGEVVCITYYCIDN